MLYDIGIRSAAALIRAGGRVLPGSRLARIAGIRRESRSIPPKKQNQKRIWIHSASVGEWANAIAVADAIHSLDPKVSVVHSVFSDSAWLDMRLQTRDPAFVLPFDTGGEMNRLVNEVAADALWFSKYDLWPNLIRAAKAAGMKTGVFSANLSRSWWFRNFSITQWRQPDLVLTIDASDSEFLAEFGIASRPAGDTRYDFIARRLAHPDPKDRIMARLYRNHQRILVAGSVYGEEELPLLQHPDFNGWHVIIVPHKIDEAGMTELKSATLRSPHSAIWIDNPSSAQFVPSSARVSVIAATGWLQSAYRISQRALIGGGYGRSVHNVLEPAACGLMVHSGPNIGKFPEARQMELLGYLRVLPDVKRHNLEVLFRNPDPPVMARRIRNWFQSGTGAAMKIAREILGSLPRS